MTATKTKITFSKEYFRKSNPSEPTYIINGSMTTDDPASIEVEMEARTLSTIDERITWEEEAPDGWEYLDWSFEITGQEEVIPIDAYLVRLNKTSQFAIDKADAPFIKSIDSVFLFDRNSRTHCCELTPSYWMIHVYDEVIFHCELSEERREQIYSKYEYCGGEDSSCYIHCHSVEQILKDNKRFTVHHIGATEVDEDDVSRDEQMDALREHYDCNHVL